MKVRDVIKILEDVDPNLDVYCLVGSKLAKIDFCRLASDDESFRPQLSGVFDYAHADSGVKYPFKIDGVLIGSSFME